jgi:hypothetical protein
VSSGVKHQPSKSPTKYCVADPPLGPPGVRLTSSTQRVRPSALVSGEQVGAFPHTAVGSDARAAETAVLGPGLQVGRAVEADVVAAGQGHGPALALGQPAQLGIADVLQARVGQHRIAGMRHPGAATVQADGQALVLAVDAAGLLGGHVVVGEGGHQRLAARRPQAGAVAVVHHRAAGEHHADVVRRQGDGLVLPAQQVGAGGMAPVHRAPHTAVRVVLVEQVVHALVEDQTVGVVHPVGGGREVVGRPPLGRVGGGGVGGQRGHRHGAQAQQEQCAPPRRIGGRAAGRGWHQAGCAAQWVRM